jgi:hypothetical protein
MKSGIFLLHWNETESQNCTAQGITTFGTQVWISCTSYIGRGRILLDGGGTACAIEVHFWNYHALQGPREFHPEYGHIGDGDYVEDRNEIWFGLEDERNPRILASALVRYNADTLEFTGLHVHSSMRTMPFIVYNALHKVAYTTNWTDNAGRLQVFDAVQLEWSMQNATINGLTDTEYDTPNGIPLIQGADMVGKTLYLMQDDFQSTLFEVQFQHDALQGQLQSMTRTGMGHEREGIDFFQNRWLLSLDNQWKTWENRHYAEVVCVSLHNQETTLRWVVGALAVLNLVWFLCLLFLVKRWRQAQQCEAAYIEVTARPPLEEPDDITANDLV